MTFDGQIWFSLLYLLVSLGRDILSTNTALFVPEDMKVVGQASSS